MKDFQKCAKGMLEFIEKSPTCFQVVANLKTELEKKGFRELREKDAWRIEPGKGYFVTRNDSSLIAFRMPGGIETGRPPGAWGGFGGSAVCGGSNPVMGEDFGDMQSDGGKPAVPGASEDGQEFAGGKPAVPDVSMDGREFAGGKPAVPGASEDGQEFAGGKPAVPDVSMDGREFAGGKPAVPGASGDIQAFGVKGFHIIAAHGDSPSFKVKESPEMAVENVYLKLNTEKYGGMILSSWLDRALSIAGRVVVKGKGGVETRLVNLEKDLLVIPSVAIHLNRDKASGTEYNPQTDMLPLYGDCAGGKKKNMLMKRIAKAAGVKADDILGHDLFLYVREKGRIVGENGDFVLSPRLDDLQCVYSASKAFLDSAPEKYVNVCAVFDNEEVGSVTKQGAGSTFLEDTLWRIGEGMDLRRGEFQQMLAGSFLISADNAHAVHPNHPEKSDPTNRPYLNGGIVIKFHGSQRYATDAVSAAKMKRICESAKTPYQTYANRSDIVGGATLGNISTSHVSVSTVDIGLPQLAMHSAVETAGVRDAKYAVDAFRVFFSK